MDVCQVNILNSLQLSIKEASICIYLIIIYCVPLCYWYASTGKLVIVGDLNIHWETENSERKRLADLLHMYDLTQHVTYQPIPVVTSLTWL